MQNLEGLRLGVDAERVLVSSSAENRAAAIALVSQGKRFLHIYSRDLEPAIYDNPPFVEAVRKLALYSQYSQIRILVQNSEKIVSQGHGLVTLAQQLSSFIQIRKPAPDHDGYNEAFLVVDKMGVLHRKLSDRYEGEVSFHTPEQAAVLVKLFDEAWERSEPDPQLRRLHIS